MQAIQAIHAATALTETTDVYPRSGSGRGRLCSACMGSMVHVFIVGDNGPCLMLLSTCRMNWGVTKTRLQGATPRQCIHFRAAGFSLLLLPPSRPEARPPSSWLLPRNSRQRLTSRPSKLQDIYCCRVFAGSSTSMRATGSLFTFFLPNFSLISLPVLSSMGFLN